MRILIAPDAFKGSLTAVQAAEAMAAGIRSAIPDAEIEMLPLADGGEGTLDVLIHHLSHEYNIITSEKYMVYIDKNNQKVALIESAHCLGLTLPAMRVLDVFRRGSGALGIRIRHGLDAGIRRFVIALGGSSTNDAGLGMLMALGLRAFDVRGGEVSPNLQGLTAVASLDSSGMDVRLKACDLTILCDVDASLCGPGGATFTFGPQKGLSAADLDSVDHSVQHFAELAEAAFGRTAMHESDSGAAGGLGFALALLGGQLVSGADYVIEKAGLAHELEGGDWVVTGEGRSDVQTLVGKLPLRVAALARAAGVSVALISGDIADGAMLSRHFDAVIAARPTNMPVETAMAQAGVLLRQATVAWATSALGSKINGLD